MVELAQSQATEAAAASPGAPRIWTLVSEKPGDMAQVQAILDALALPWEPKRLIVAQRWQITNPPFRPDLDHLDRARSDRLVPPWPDLVIASGRRMAGPQLWIKQQSGGRTKLVLVGRPRRWLERFDLVIGTSQYRLPPKPNVLRLDLPLMRPAIEAVAKAREEWAPNLASLPRPLIAVLVGGQTKPFRFDAEVARDLMRRSQALAEAEGGGTLYVTTSRRTPKPVADALAAALPANARLYLWRPDGGGENPYFGLLAHADRFIVTGDSASMMVEVARLGRPLLIYDLPRRVGRGDRFHYALAQLVHVPSGMEGVWWRRLLHPVGDLLYRYAAIGYSRDLGDLHQVLIRRGLATRLGDPTPPRPPEAVDEVALVAERIRALLGLGKS